MSEKASIKFFLHEFDSLKCCDVTKQALQNLRMGCPLWSFDSKRSIFILQYVLR